MTPGREGDTRLRWHLLAIFAAAVALRVLAVAHFPEAPRNDPADYHGLAERLVRGEGYTYGGGKPTAFRVCGYPLFLAAIYKVLGPDWYDAELVQAVMGGGTVLSIVALAWLVVGRRQALLSGHLAAIYPALVFVPRLLLSENLSIFLQMAALCATVLVLRRPGATRALGLGILLGLNLLVRGSSVFMVALILLGLAATAGGRLFDRRGMTLASVALLAICATLAPWAARNYAAFRHFVPIATEDGITLYISYWPVREGGKSIWGNVPGEEDPIVAEAYRQGNEALMSRYLRGVAVRRLLARPSRAFELAPVKLLNLLVPLDWEVLPPGAGRDRAINYGYLAALLPASIGAWSLRSRRARDAWVLWVPPASVVMVALIFYGSPRFRLAAEPVLLIFASCGLLVMKDKVVSHRRDFLPSGHADRPRGEVTIQGSPGPPAGAARPTGHR